MFGIWPTQRRREPEAAKVRNGDTFECASDKGYKGDTRLSTQQQSHRTLRAKSEPVLGRNQERAGKIEMADLMNVPPIRDTREAHNTEQAQNKEVNSESARERKMASLRRKLARTAGEKK